MLIIVDQKIPFKAKEALKKHGELLELSTTDITYEAISGHPDIFFTQVKDQLIIAPNLPQNYIDILDKHQLNYVLGEEAVGEKYPVSSKYNVVCNDQYLIHNFRNTDSVITQTGEDHDLIHVDQGYTRCNLISLNKNAYLTSDKGIAKVLDRYHLSNVYVNPKSIELPGFNHGFFGGCCGVYEQKLFVLGSIDQLEEKSALRKFLEVNEIELIELYQGPLFDGGSILFLST